MVLYGVYINFELFLSQDYKRTEHVELSMDRKTYCSVY